MALWEWITEVLFLRQVQEFVTPTINDYSVIVNEDNQGAIKMADKFSSKRTRHIDMKHHAIRDAVEEGKVKVEYLVTEEQHAVVLTKARAAQKFEKRVIFFMNE